MRLNPLHVAIIGGGYAGLAAAVTLAEQAVPVTLFEAANHWGGRARRIVINKLNLDNGQHILLGAYHELKRLMDLVGTAHDALLTLPLTLSFPGNFTFKARSLPSPWHLAIGLILAEGISNGTRLRMLASLLRLAANRFYSAEDVSVETWMSKTDQPSAACDFLWRPLCYAALNTPSAQASSKVFLNVLKKSFKRRHDSDLLLPRADLSALFPERALAFLALRGGVAHLSSAVKNVEAAPAGFTISTDKVRASFSHVICATAPWHVQRLIVNLPGLTHLTAQLETLKSQPIYTIYLQYPAFVTLPFPMVGMTRGLVQWVFDRGRLQGHAGLLAAVISAEGSHQLLSHEELAAQVQQELQSHLGTATPLWHQVIAEKRATFSCVPELSRPTAITAQKDFFLAGDYLHEGLPATLESAVLSGVGAARAVLRSVELGR